MKKTLYTVLALLASCTLSIEGASAASANIVDDSLPRMLQVNLGPVATAGFAFTQIPLIAEATYPYTPVLAPEAHELYQLVSMAPTTQDVIINPGICYNLLHIAGADLNISDPNNPIPTDFNTVGYRCYTPLIDGDIEF